MNGREPVKTILLNLGLIVWNYVWMVLCANFTRTNNVSFHSEVIFVLVRLSCHIRNEIFLPVRKRFIYYYMYGDSLL